MITFNKLSYFNVIKERLLMDFIGLCWVIVLIGVSNANAGSVNRSARKGKSQGRNGFTSDLVFN